VNQYDGGNIRIFNLGGVMHGRRCAGPSSTNSHDCHVGDFY
jgi:hypothetical protein